MRAAAATQPPVTADPLAPCEALLKTQPGSPDGYQCLLGQMRQERPRVGPILEARVRARPDDPWARFYRAIFQTYSGNDVPESEFARAVDGFRRSGSTQGLVYALTSQLGQRCFAEDRCDAQALGLLEEAERVAERSDDLHARRVAQLWWLRWAIKEDDVARAERAEQRLDALPAGDPAWMASLLAGQRAFLAGELRDYEGKLSRYAELLRASAPGSPQHASALGGHASAAASLALRGSFDRAEAERELRAALSEQDGHGMQVSFADPTVGALSTRAHLALLLGPTAESLSLLDEAIAGYRARQGWSYPWYAYWLRARYLSEGPSPRFWDALEAAEAAVQRASLPSTAWERARSVLMRAVVRWRAGDAAAAREDALTALAALEQLRARQRDGRVRMRYEDTLAFAYELVAGSLLEHSTRPPSSADIASALETMERLRARGLLEILVRGHRARGELDRAIQDAQRRLLDVHLGADERVALVTRLRADERGLRESAGETVQLPAPPGIDELQKALRPEEALVSFQQWTGEADVTAPIVESTSWAIVVTGDRRWAVRVAGARDVDAAARLWLSLLERRDGSDLGGGASLYRALLAPVVESLPASVSALIVVPDAVIDRVPLEALPLSGSGPYLGERYSVSVVPSAAVWLRLRGAPPRNGGAALALAEPDLSGAAREELARLQRSRSPAPPESERGKARSVGASGNGPAAAGRGGRRGPFPRRAAGGLLSDPHRLPRAGGSGSAGALGAGPRRGRWRGRIAHGRGDLGAAAGPAPGGARGLSHVRWGAPSRRGDAEPRACVLRGRREDGHRKPRQRAGRGIGGALRWLLPAHRRRAAGRSGADPGEARAHPCRSAGRELGQLPAAGRLGNDSGRCPREMEPQLDAGCVARGSRRTLCPGSTALASSVEVRSAQGIVRSIL